MNLKVKRRTFFIRGGVQGRYLGMIVIAMVLPTLFVTACLYYLIIAIVAEEIGIPEAIVSALFPAIDRINRVLLMGVPSLFILIFIWALILSHRFAGPIYRLEKDLDKIAKGDFSVRIKFRKKDEIAHIAEGINKVLDSVQGQSPQQT